MFTLKDFISRLQSYNHNVRLNKKQNRKVALISLKFQWSYIYMYFRI